MPLEPCNRPLPCPPGRATTKPADGVVQHWCGSPGFVNTASLMPAQPPKDLDGRDPERQPEDDQHDREERDGHGHVHVCTAKP